jgi:hypothetical protein
MPRTAAIAKPPQEQGEAYHPDPMLTGINALRERDEDSLIVAKCKGPKQFPGSTIEMVMFNGEALLMLQRPSGKFTLFKKFELNPTEFIGRLVDPADVIDD